MECTLVFALILDWIIRLGDLPKRHLLLQLVWAFLHYRTLHFFNLLFFGTAREETQPSPDWQLDSTDGGKPPGPPQLDPVLIYSPTGSMDTPPSTPAGSMDSELFEGRDRLLSRSPRKGPNVFTVSFKSLNRFVVLTTRCLVAFTLATFSVVLSKPCLVWKSVL